MTEKGREPRGGPPSHGTGSRFRALAAAVDGGVFEVDASGRVAGVDDGFVERTGRDREDLVGTPAAELFESPDGRFAGVLDASRVDESGPATVTSQSGDPVSGTLRLQSVGDSDDAAGVVGVFEPHEDAHVRSHEQRRRTLESLHAAAADEERSIDERIEAVLDVVHEELATDYATLSRVTDDEYVFESVRSPADVDIEPGTVVDPETLPVCSNVVETAESLALRDVAAEAPELTDPAWGIQSYVGAPVVVDGDVYGTFCFYGTEPAPEAFTDWETTLVDLAAAWVSEELERKRAREERHEQRVVAEATRQRYETLVENFPNGAVGLVDEDLRYTTVGGEPMTDQEQSPVDLAGRRVDEVLSDDLADVMVPKYRAALDGAAETFEVDVADRVVQYRTFPVRDDEGNVAAAMGVSQDVTDQKNRERELSRYKSLVETVNEGIYVVDDDYRYTTVNDAFVELSGYSREELLGAHASLVVDDSTIDAAADIREQDDDGTPSLETTMVLADGSELPVEVTFTTLDTDGVSQRVGVVRDISARREQRRQLEESERRYRALVENFPHGGVGVFDDTLEYTLVDGTMWDDLPVDAADVEGSTIWEALPEETASDVEPVFRAALNGETGSVESTLGDRTFRVWATPLRDADGEVRAGQSIALDVTEQKEREQRLERTLDLLERTEQIADVGGWEIDVETMDVFWSDHIFEILGVDADEPPSLDEALDMYHEDDQPVVRAAVEGAIEDGEAFDIEVRNRTATGEVRWLRLQGAPETEHGDVVVVRGASQDVTERKEREQFLKDAKAQMEAAAEAGAVGTWEWHVPEDRLVADAALAERFGVDSDQARAGVPLDQLIDAIHEDDQDRVEAAIERALETGGEYEQEYRVLDADGEIRWVVARGHVECDEDGTPRTFPGALTDITDQKRVEQRAKRQRRELETLFDVLPVGVVVAHSEGELVEANEEAREIWGGDVSDASSVAEYARYDTWWEDTGERVEPEEVTMARVLRGEAVDDPDILTIEGDDGSERTIMVHGKPVVDDDGDVERGVVTLTDITERREYQRKLEASNERLEQFAYAASHDLQEPLRMISSYLSLIADRYEDLLDEDGEEFLEYAVDGADRMQEMIDALLQYSRVQTEGEAFEPVDLDAVFADVRQNYELRIEETDADIEAESLPTVVGDEDQLRQVFGNLLSNALEYSGDEPPEVTVSAEHEGDEWVIAVHDEGIGIADEHVDRIFEVFQHLHSQDQHAGTGIGLALAQRVVERHGGDIWVESEPGEGSTFYFSIPEGEESHD